MEAEPERAEAPRRGGVAGVSGPGAGAAPASPSGALGPWTAARRGRGAGGRLPWGTMQRKSWAGPGRAERPAVGPSSAAGRAGRGGGAHTCGGRSLCAVRAPRLAAGRGAAARPCLAFRSLP